MDIKLLLNDLTIKNSKFTNYCYYYKDWQITNYFGHKLVLVSKDLHLQFTKYLEFTFLKLFWTSINNITAERFTFTIYKLQIIFDFNSY